MLHLILHAVGRAISAPIHDWMNTELRAPVGRVIEQALAAAHAGQPPTDPEPRRPLAVHLHRRWLIFGFVGVLLWVTIAFATWFIGPGEGNAKIGIFILIAFVLGMLTLLPGMICLLSWKFTRVELSADELQVRGLISVRKLPLNTITAVFMKAELGMFGPIVRVSSEDQGYADFWADQPGVDRLVASLLYYARLKADQRAAEAREDQARAAEVIRQAELLRQSAGAGTAAARDKIALLDPAPERPLTFRLPSATLKVLWFSIAGTLGGVSCAFKVKDNAGVSLEGLVQFVGIFIALFWVPSLIVIPPYLFNWVRFTERELEVRKMFSRRTLRLRSLRSIADAENSRLLITSVDEPDLYLRTDFKNIELLVKVVQYHILANSVVDQKSVA